MLDANKRYQAVPGLGNRVIHRTNCRDNQPVLPRKYGIDHALIMQSGKDQLAGKADIKTRASTSKTSVIMSQSDQTLDIDSSAPQVAVVGKLPFLKKLRRLFSLKARWKPSHFIEGQPVPNGKKTANIEIIGSQRNDHITDTSVAVTATAVKRPLAARVGLEAKRISQADGAPEIGEALARNTVSTTQKVSTIDELPSTQLAPATEGAVSTEETPIAEDALIAEKAPIAEEAPISEEAPTAVQAPTIENDSTTEEASPSLNDRTAGKRPAVGVQSSPDTINASTQQADSGAMSPTSRLENTPPSMETGPKITAITENYTENRPCDSTTVLMRLPLKERLKHLSFASLEHFIIDGDAAIPDADMEKYMAFESAFNENHSVWLHGLPEGRNIALWPVSISRKQSGTAETYICIGGLSEKEDIKKFHAKLSQRNVRNIYYPLGLCFEKLSTGSSIQVAASNSPYNGESENDWTLCGRPISTGDGAYTTIGGVLLVKGKLGIITVEHPDNRDNTVQQISSDPTSDTLAAALIDSLVEDGKIDDDVDPPFVWEADNPVQPVPPNPLSRDNGSYFRSEWTVRRRAAPVFTGRGWTILSADAIPSERAVFPNSTGLPHGTDRPLQGASDTYAFGSAYNRVYFSKFAQKLESLEVLIIAGRSGKRWGKLSPNPASLKLANDRIGFTRVWRISLAPGTCRF